MMGIITVEAFSFLPADILLWFMLTRLKPFSLAKVMTSIAVRRLARGDYRKARLDMEA
jgi:hypothetical protein